MNANESFGRDIDEFGSYKYSGESARLSSQVANKNISDNFMQHLRGSNLLDIGCGDGEFTAAYLELEFQKIIGFDIETKAVESARQKFKHLKNIEFTDIPLENFINRGDFFECISIRGALHHMHDLENGISMATRLGNRIVVAEPNGLNPILKVIEKISPYHRHHGEKSFTASKLTREFARYNFQRTYLGYCGVVPFFFPKFLSLILLRIEPAVEKNKIFRFWLCGTQILVFEKLEAR